PLQSVAAPATVLLLFFLSGATSLVYEVVWMRRITLVFGASQLAIATVLAAFMAGLAMGSHFGGRWSDRSRSLLLLYGLLEVVIGLYALLFPWLVEQGVSVYGLAVSAEAVEFWYSRSIHLLVMGTLLLVPTAAMGATLPLLVRLVSGRLSRVGRWVGWLYGVNTGGAVLGVFLAGFVLLPALGVRSTEVLAAVANLGVAVFALVLSRSSFLGARGAAGEIVDDRREVDEENKLFELPEDADLEGPRRGRVRQLVLVLLACSGFCAMLYEVAWSRLLGLILGSSVYAFSLMLIAFLLGTALGAPVGSFLLARRGRRPLGLLALVLCLAPVTAWISHFGFGQLPYWYVDLYALSGGADSLVFPIQGLIAVGVMTPTTFFIGMAFPVAMEVITRDPGQVGRDVARLYVLNTLGAVLGALVAGFVLLPLLGIRSTLAVAVGIGLVLSALAWGARRQSGAKRLVGLGALAAGAGACLLLRPTWDPLLMSAGMYKYVSDLTEYSHEAVRDYALSDFELLYYSEGTTSVVTVARSLDSGNIWLANNGKVDASSHEDLQTQLLLGHLPFLHRPGAASALVVGLGSGITAGSVTLQPSLESIDILEIEPAVVVASHYFDEHNRRPLEDPRVRLLRNDARNHLVLYEGFYDVIINEPSNPWISGVSNLFTLEFLQLGRARLVPEGLFCQWVQTYGMGQDDLRSLLRTFAEVFPRVLLYQAPGDADLLLVGSQGDLNPFSRDLGTWFHPERVEDLARVGVQYVYDLLAFQRLDRAAVLALADGIGLNTDDNVRIEFSAPHHLHYATAEANEELIASHSRPPWDLQGQLASPGAELSTLLGLGSAYAGRERFDEAEAAYRRAEQSHPGAPVIQERRLLLEGMREEAGVN
ncbi:MAG: fused MFS/spermidine synthase, partial [Myxococcota bacterium]|nr:fused MFS/spermidine synthase [Myxococcota bacterium]